MSVLVRKHNDGRLPSELFDSALLELRDEIIDNENLSLTSVDDQLIFSSQGLIVQHNINATDIDEFLNLSHQVCFSNGRFSPHTSRKTNTSSYSFPHTSPGQTPPGTC